jgi:hypothetical protein
VSEWPHTSVPARAMTRDARLTDAKRIGNAAVLHWVAWGGVVCVVSATRRARVRLASRCAQRHVTLNSCKGASRGSARASARLAHAPYSAQLRCLCSAFPYLPAIHPCTLCQPDAGDREPRQHHQRFSFLWRQIDFGCNSHFSLQECSPLIGVRSTIYVPSRMTRYTRGKLFVRMR